MQENVYSLLHGTLIFICIFLQYRYVLMLVRCRMFPEMRWRSQFFLEMNVEVRKEGGSEVCETVCFPSTGHTRDHRLASFSLVCKSVVGTLRRCVVCGCAG